MKILIDGFGSIGQRHANNLAKLGFKNIIIVSRKKLVKKKFKKFKIVKKLKDALMQKPNIALICNPTSLHDKSILLCAENNCNLFVEKPVSSTLKNEKKINNLLKKKKFKLEGKLESEFVWKNIVIDFY